MADDSMVLEASISYPKLEGLPYKDILAMLRFRRDEIGQKILDKVEARTPKLTGALREDEAYRPLGGTGGILEWYVGNAWQLGEWGREYAVYQEGKPLGERGYTHGPWQMFNRITTDDLTDIEEWATDVVEEAVGNVFQTIETEGAS